ncbi:hypothetical protein SD70_06675 [Gordoniibacillus kamchatkensis]|uniref:Uncharacterized protein n=1 Tax=Gordoniibacillus kamchatkensis TaxID=1590651 RepID=A0ABR5AKM6_9BACL|nr:hypothetical protein [Paenibacillus sp. VKM B-2647]KIL41544.1 hypothetical protein SD70_06675 [Paenibacillus sp. VKM B-2647]
MAAIPRLLLVGVLSAAIALTLALVPQLQEAWLSSKETSSAFGSAGGRQLTESNVVDVLVQVPLQLRIRKVELTSSTLSVDLNLPRSADEEVVIRDLYTIAQRLFASTSNVGEVFVRVMDYSATSRSSGGKLLLALDAVRERGKDMAAPGEHESVAVLEQYLRQHFQMTYTDKWRERYPF